MRNRETGHRNGGFEGGPEDMGERPSPKGFPRLAYIKIIGLPQARAMGLVVPSEIHLPENVKLYALHAADGTALGITDSWDSAYTAAVQNDFQPLSVH